MTAPGGTGTSVLQYTYVAPKPTVTGVSPNSGPTAGGNTVTVTGTGFSGASKVSFGSIPAANFTVNSDTSITVTAPPGLARIIDVTVTTGNQPAPSDEGGNFNTVSGTATDQCAAISER